MKKIISSSLLAIFLFMVKPASAGSDSEVARNVDRFCFQMEQSFIHDLYITIATLIIVLLVLYALIKSAVRKLKGEDNVAKPVINVVLALAIVFAAPIIVQIVFGANVSCFVPAIDSGQTVYERQGYYLEGTSIAQVPSGSDYSISTSVGRSPVTSPSANARIKVYGGGYYPLASKSVSPGGAQFFTVPTSVGSPPLTFGEYHVELYVNGVKSDEIVCHNAGGFLYGCGFGT